MDGTVATTRSRQFSCWDHLHLSFLVPPTGESADQTHLGCEPQFTMGIGQGLATRSLTPTTRDWRIYADFAQVLWTARELHADDDFGVELQQTACARLPRRSTYCLCSRRRSAGPKPR